MPRKSITEHSPKTQARLREKDRLRKEERRLRETQLEKRTRQFKDKIYHRKIRGSKLETESGEVPENPGPSNRINFKSLMPSDDSDTDSADAYSETEESDESEAEAVDESILHNNTEVSDDSEAEAIPVVEKDDSPKDVENQRPGFVVKQKDLGAAPKVGLSKFYKRPSFVVKQKDLGAAPKVGLSKFYKR